MKMTTELREHPRAEMIFSDHLEEHAEFLETKLRFETQAREYNFDSGPALEDFFRSTIRKLLPSRFAVEAGTIIDRKGNTCGDCDVIIYDATLSPLVRTPATAGSRKKYIPFEIVYCVIEVKQSLTLGTLDSVDEVKAEPTGSLVEMFSKCSTFKSLEREESQRHSIVSKEGVVLVESQWKQNYPYAFGFAYRLGTSSTEVDPDGLVKEFSHNVERVGQSKTLDGICVNKARIPRFRFEDRTCSRRPFFGKQPRNPLMLDPFEGGF
ncbi:MAG: hypothetical protein AUK47_12935 [Deltaproteobacteria bacterium CG2_30_63_29]|nr:MAG: hypothetical protein AUK47_12935 [Deltaproteobacteria bacterium CG2_30_63_29]PJB34141.1 MAG: hypothetical protein CO108_29120 [Deltaproteobacteria bacterium CG_4_9_14_3_um_filter_63_12]